MYLLCWRRHGGLQYIGMSQDVDRRINAHRRAGRLPFTKLGDPAIEVLHFGLNVYAACDAERREIMARRTMTPHGYNESLGGEYAGSRSDTLFSSDHLYRLSRAAVGVERMDRATHEEEAGTLAASGVEAVKERYWEACSVVVELWRSGIYEGRIAAFRAPRLKNVSSRSRASIQRWARSTAPSTAALSLGCLGRAGTTTAP